MGNKHTIEFNGKTYDALTGRLIKPGPSAAKSVATQATDGLIKAKPQAAKHKPAPVQKPAPKLAPTTKPKRPTANQNRGHQPAHSKTLMRAGVRKPGRLTKPIDQVKAPVHSPPAKQVSASPVAARLAIDERRLARSQQTAHSSAISRFRAGATERFTTKVESLPVKKPGVYAKPPAKKTRPSAGKRLDNILSAGLAKAISHDQPATTAKARRQSKSLLKRKWFWLVAVIVVILVAGGIVLSYFAPNIEFAVATSRSGVHINRPVYKPAGFSLIEPIDYASGTITINYSDKNTGRQFNIVAQNSGWDSQTLLDSFVMGTDSNYQTLQRTDGTFYVYLKTNVTWVNGGVWYRLSGSSGLSTSQLVNIATSM